MGVCCCRYVYERLTVPGRKPTFGTLLATELVCAVWPGVYPGYIMFFAGVSWLSCGSLTPVPSHWVAGMPVRHGCCTKGTVTVPIVALQQRMQ
jgi:hypothetical protein